ncbi:MAG: branched-chain amino acid aminotransferase [Candidatus Lokiarchaeota archaeon]|nr:branched-chain amino acid aminotransferase [Candidatus Lokiarchaeota archaeon]
MSDKIDWDNLGFDFLPTKTMWLSECEDGKTWKDKGLVPFKNFEISPAACVLNYGQGIFEGMKALRTKNDEIVLFRPIENGKRFKDSAERLCIPPYDPNKFVEAVKKVVKANVEYIPPYGKGALYIRPVMWGTGPMLGVAPAPSYTFIIWVSPVGPYFKTGFNPIKLEISKKYHRAAPKGVGAAKTICNYAPTMLPAIETKKKGFAQIIYLDAANEKYIEEVGTANFFAVLDEVLVTPRAPKDGSILPGVTRKSVVQLAKEKLGMRVEERDVSYEEVFEASEVFCTGTAAVVTPIGSIAFEGKEYTYNNFKVGAITQKLYDLLTKIQLRELDDPYGWVILVTEA